MKFFIVKIYDHDCPVCAETSKYDQFVAEDMEIDFLPISLEKIASALKNPSTSFINKVAWRVKGSCLEEDGTITLPIYLIYRVGTESFEGVLEDFVNEEEFKQQLEKLLVTRMTKKEASLKAAAQYFCEAQGMDPEYMNQPASGWDSPLSQAEGDLSSLLMKLEALDHARLLP